MIKSMTGYGKSGINKNGHVINVEIKSLNSKQSDISVKMPSYLREYEQEIRNAVLQHLERGKIEVFINLEHPDGFSFFTINKELFHKYFEEVEALSKNLNADNLLPVIMQLPDVVKQQPLHLDFDLHTPLIEAVNEAVLKLDIYRKDEGAVLLSDFKERIIKIVDAVSHVEKFEKRRLDNLRNKFNDALTSLISDDKIDKNRLEQELIYYIEKIDFTEEKIRLKQHGDYFLSTLNLPNSNGKKLMFIVQEMSREINTMGAKANDFDIQKIVVEMKDELEKIKEQLSNIL